jgi:hypothetical protein
MKTKEQLLKEKAKIEAELKRLEENEEDGRLTFWKQWSDEKYCLEAVKQDGYALEYVKLPSAFEKITGLKLSKELKEK